MANQVRALGNIGLPALCSHIKLLKSIIFELGNAFQGTMVEIEEAINDFPIASSISISTQGWQSVTPANSMGDYEYYYDINHDTIDSSDLPVVTVAPTSLEVAADCGLCPTCESLNGKIRLYAKSIPDNTISVSCWVIKGQTSAEKSSAMEEIAGWDAVGSVTGGNA